MPDTKNRILSKGSGYAYAGLLTVALALAGCAVGSGGAGWPQAAAAPARTEIATTQGVDALHERLSGLDAGVNHAEARRVAETAIVYSHTLAASYRVVRPAPWHNLLVRLGLRDRGLCYHWTTDLMRELQALGLTSLELYWGVAHQGSELLEHNSVVITARGRPFESGIVLDPWRDSGKLFWTAVAKDRYPWRELPRKLW